MAITRKNESEDPSNDGISDYEKLRLEKIKRNEDRMKELGLFRTKDAISASVKKRKAKKITPDLPQRRSSRQRKAVVDYSDEQVIPMYEDDEEKAKTEESYSDTESTSNDEEDAEEDDYDASDNEDDDEDEDEPPTKRSRPSKPNKVQSQSGAKKTPIDTTFVCVNAKGGLTLEYAKTGRSSCRKCRDKIDKGKPRVGMEAWIVGRNCVTWQHPSCLLHNMCCLYEKSNGGKGKCKVSHIPFVKGQLKIGIRCHTATSYYRIEAIQGVLANVVALLRTESGKESFELKVDGIDGNEKLSTEDRAQLASILETVFQNKQTTPLPDKPKSEPAAEVASPSKPKIPTHKTKNRDQPKVGTKSGAKGKVEWKFGGRKCYGTLIPRMETKTHCYARTHKGNVKTLAKGKDYWSMAE